MIIRQPSRLQATYTSLAGVRAAGVIVMLASLAGATAILVAGRTGDEKCDDDGECHQPISAGAVAGASLVGVIGVAAGIFTLGAQDTVTVDVVPMATAPRVGSDARSGAGLALRIRF